MIFFVEDVSFKTLASTNQCDFFRGEGGGGGGASARQEFYLRRRRAGVVLPRSCPRFCLYLVPIISRRREVEQNHAIIVYSNEEKRFEKGCV